MVRRVRADGQSVAQSAKAFGLSRPSFYQAQAALEREGLSGLLAKKRGPRRSHKLGAEVMEFLQEQLSQEPSLSSLELAARVRQRFKLQVHSRSIERARLSRTPITFWDRPSIVAISAGEKSSSVRMTGCR